MMCSASTVSANNINTVDVKYTEPEKFIDFASTLSSKQNYKRLISEFSYQLNRLSRRVLKDGQQLKVNFLDIDMAGRISPNTYDLRSVKIDTDRSVLNFDFILVDKKGQEIASGHEKLTTHSLRFINNRANWFNESQFKYELAMFDKWLKKLTRES